MILKMEKPLLSLSRLRLSWDISLKSLKVQTHNLLAMYSSCICCVWSGNNPHQFSADGSHCGLCLTHDGSGTNWRIAFRGAIFHFHGCLQEGMRLYQDNLIMKLPSTKIQIQETEAPLAKKMYRWENSLMIPCADDPWCLVTACQVILAVDSWLPAKLARGYIQYIAPLSHG